MSDGIGNTQPLPIGQQGFPDTTHQYAQATPGLSSAGYPLGYQYMQSIPPPGDHMAPAGLHNTPQGYISGQNRHIPLPPLRTGQDAWGRALLEMPQVGTWNGYHAPIPRQMPTTAEMEAAQRAFERQERQILEADLLRHQHQWQRLRSQDRMQPAPQHLQEYPTSQRVVSDIPNQHALPARSQYSSHTGVVAAHQRDSGVGGQVAHVTPILYSDSSSYLHQPQPRLATHAPASTPTGTAGATAAARRDSQSPTPTSRRRSSTRRSRKVSHDATNFDHRAIYPTSTALKPSFTREQLERYYPPLRYTPQSQGSARRNPLEGATRLPQQPATAAQPAQKDVSPSRRNNSSMASGGGKWREEQILIICPGSRTTMAQLGCSELTPPAHRIPTRMFRDGDEWRPYYTYKRTKIVGGEEQEEWVEDVDEDKGAVYPIEGKKN